MLMNIRDKAKGWLAWVVIGLLIIIFGLWGIADYVGGNTDNPTVAKVNGDNISLRQAQQFYLQILQQQQAYFAANNINLPIDEDAIKQQALQQLIIQQLLTQSANDKNLAVTQAEINQAIANIPEFQEDGVYSPARFTQIAASLGMSSEGLQQEIANDLLVNQLNNGIQLSAFSLAQEAEHTLALIGEQRVINYAALDVERYKDSVSISEDDAINYYNNQQDAFRTPEQVSLNYVELRLSDIQDQIQISDQEIEDYYQQNIANYTVPEQRRVSQILVSLPSNATPDDVAQAEDRLTQVSQRLHQGEAFADVAREVSDDVISAQQGGDMGWLSPDDSFDTAFVQAAFALDQVNELSSPIRSAFGLHLIEVTDIREQQQEPLTDVADTIKTQLETQQSQTLFLQQVDELSLVSFEQSDNLEGVGDQLGLTVMQTDLFSRAGGSSGITTDPSVIQAAFSDDILIDRYNSDVIHIDDDNVVVIRLNQHIPASVQPFADVQVQITDQLVTQHAAELARHEGQALEQQLKAGGDPTTVATALQVEWHDNVTLDRDPSNDPNISPELITAVFNMPKPLTPEQPSYLGLSLSNGDYFVITLTEVLPGEMPESEDVRVFFNQQMTQAIGSADYQLYIENLYQSAKIRTYPDKF